MAINIELLIPTISALAGAIIGGGSTALITWYSFKKQWEKDIWIQRLDRLEKVDKGLFAPFLHCAYRLDAKRDADDIDCILGVLRNGRNYFAHCPKYLKRMLFDLYSDIEKTIEKREGKWNDGDIDKLSIRIKQIEEEIHMVLRKMEL